MPRESFMPLMSGYRRRVSPERIAVPQAQAAAMGAS